MKETKSIPGVSLSCYLCGVFYGVKADVGYLAYLAGTMAQTIQVTMDMQPRLA